MLASVLKRVVGILLVLVPATLSAAGIEVALHVTPAVGAECHFEQLLLRPTCPNECGDGEKEISLTTPEAHVTLPGGEVTWRIGAVSADCWSDEAVITPEDRSASPLAVSLQLRSIGFFHVQVMGADDASLDQLTVAVSSSSQASLDHRFRGWGRCTRKGHDLTCAIPAGMPLDLQLQAPGHAPAYVFDVAVGRGKTVNVEPQQLVKGASITARVRTAAGAPVAHATVTAIPAGIAENTESRDRLRAVSAQTNARGFVQLRGLGEGDYILQSEKAGLSKARSASVSLKAGQAVEVSEIVHQPLQNLDVWLSPPVAGTGRPWRVALEQVITGTRYTHEISPHAASLAGNWRSEGNDAGDYTIVVTDDLGNVFKREPAELFGGSRVLTVQLDGIPVRGVIRGGKAPFEGRLSCRSGSLEAQIVTDAAGNFAGILPGPGLWRIAIIRKTRDLLVRREVRVARDAADAKGFFWMDFELDHGVVRGEVIDPRKKPVARANIYVRRGEKELAQGVSDDAGQFEIVGVPTGGASLQASISGVGQSSVVNVDVGEDTTPVELVYEADREVRGAVITESGRGVAGALLRFVNPDFRSIPETISAPDGSFSASLPQSDKAVEVVALPGVYPARVFSVPMEEMQKSLMVVVSREGGLLKVPVPGAPPWPTITNGGATIPMTLLLYPRDGTSPYPRGMTRKGLAIELEPGSYSVCFGDRCQAVRLTDRSEVTAQFDGDGARAQH